MVRWLKRTHPAAFTALLAKITVPAVELAEDNICPGQSCSKWHLSWNLQGGGLRLNRRLWTRHTEMLSIMVYAHLEQLCFCASSPHRSCPMFLSPPLHQNWQSSDGNTKLYRDFKPAIFSSHSTRRCGGDWNTTNFYQINHGNLFHR